MLRQTAPPALRATPATRSHPPANSIEGIGAPMTFGRNAEIYGDSEPADYLYQVIRGTVRTSKVLTDGRRQIGGFYLPAISSGSRRETTIAFRPQRAPT